MKPEKEDVHRGCPNRFHCKKDEEKCCYLVKGKCYLEHGKAELFL